MKYLKEIRYIEIKRLLEMGVIVLSCYEIGEFVLIIFVRLKLDGFYWLILNLKRFNEYVVYYYFKMELLKLVL